MDCKNAQKVWGHEGGFIKGVKKVYPGVVEHIERLARNLINGDTNPFDTAVKQAAGGNPDSYYLEHGEDTDPVLIGTHEVVGDEAGRLMLQKHLQETFGRKILLGNVCCSACRAYLPDFESEHITKSGDGPPLAIRIQQAAVMLQADGTPFSIN